MRLVKQIRVVTNKLILVGNMRSQSLYERLFSEPYRKIFRYDPLNNTVKYCMVVPSYRKNLLRKFIILDQGADHVRTHNLSIRQRRQKKCVLNESLKNNGLIFRSSFSKRHYSCKVINGFIKIDVSVNNIRLLTTSRQGVRNKVMENQRNLSLLKKEILSESEYLTPLLIKSIKQGIWPMLKFNKELKILIKKRQMYLAMLSNQYGFRSAKVKQQVNEWLTKLDLRVFAIETVYESPGNFIPGVDNLILKRENLLNYLEILKYNNLKHYKTDQTRKVYLPKGKNDKYSLEILTIKDRIVQTLFVQVIEPTIDVYADNHSFGFRKGRNSHQAIGLLSKLLQVKSAHQKRHTDKQYFTHSKYILNIEIEKFFGKSNCDWLLENYPFPNNFSNILKKWLSDEIIYQEEYEIPITGFPQGSIIGPSLANFTLNGLEKIRIPDKLTVFDEKKSNYYVSKNIHYNKSFVVEQKTISSNLVRYASYVIIVVNDKSQIKLISNEINIFLQERGLNKNSIKNIIFKWKNNIKFDYLGFTFNYILEKKNSKITTQRKLKQNLIRNSLYVYPSKIKVQMFKTKIKEIVKNNLNVTPYRLINILNPVIKDWGNYFGIGTFKIFSKLDHYIWYRIWRYLRRKYKKVSVKNLINNYFKGINTPSGRTWQFHGTLNDVNKYTKKRKGIVVWLLLLSKLNKVLPAHVFSPSKTLVRSTYYINESVFTEYDLKIVKMRSKKKC